MQTETGYTAVVMVDGSGEYRLPLEDYTRVRQEWMQGVAFLDVTGYFGETVTIKTARVEAVTRFTAQALAARAAHDAEQRRADAIGGGL